MSTGESLTAHRAWQVTVPTFAKIQSEQRISLCGRLAILSLQIAITHDIPERKPQLLKALTDLAKEVSQLGIEHSDFWKNPVL